MNMIVEPPPDFWEGTRRYRPPDPPPPKSFFGRLWRCVKDLFDIVFNGCDPGVRF